MPPPPLLPSGEIDLAGRCALVTGGSRGIGRAVVERLLAAGMRVLATGRDAERLQQLAAELACDRLATQVYDQADPAQVTQLFGRARQLFPSLFLLVNNAGLGIYGPCETVSLADWDQVQNVNARGLFLCSQAAFVWMKRSGGGRIVNIASVVGHKGYENQVAYTASKHAVLGITKVMAREGLPHGIRVCAVCPGGVATDMVRQARPDLDPQGLIQPQNVARAVYYLAAEPETCCSDVLYLRRSASTPFA